MNNAHLSLGDRRLRDSLEAVYCAFAAQPPSMIEGCPCCISKRGVDVLLITPLRQITGQALWDNVSGVFLTVGSERDFRYLLPRILEVSVTDPENANDPEIVLGKLQLANWRLWSTDEQQTIQTYINAWFEHELANDIAGADEGFIGGYAESVLCGAARAGLPLRRWLLRLHEPDAAAVLADMQARFPGSMSRFWDDAPVGYREVAAILTKGTA